ncbi:MAG: Tm-1-like ATP-binding domain-containing protein, partial [Vicinamibacterales bacterium]
MTALDYTEGSDRGQTGVRPRVLLFATLDTKGREAGYVRELLTSWSVPVTLVDVGALGAPAVAADIPRERIFALAGTTADAVRKQADRGEAVTRAAEGAAQLAR